MSKCRKSLTPYRKGKALEDKALDHYPKDRDHGSTTIYVRVPEIMFISQVLSSGTDKAEEKHRALCAHGAKVVNLMGYQGSPSAGCTGVGANSLCHHCD